MFIITEWIERYEVNDKGQPARKGDKLRKSPLEYIRSKVYGRSQGAGFAAMQKIAKLKTYEVFGLFQKFLEIQGAEKAEKRIGPLLNARGEPATVDDIAFICRFPKKNVEYALQVLTHPNVRWMSKILIGENGEIIPEFPGNSGNSWNSRSVLEHNTTQHNTTQHNTTQHNTTKEKGNSSSKKQFLDFVFLSEDEHKKLIERFGEKQTDDYIERLNNGIGSKGYKYKSHYFTILNWSRKDANNRNKKTTRANKSQRTTPERDFTGQNSEFGETINV